MNTCATNQKREGEKYLHEKDEASGARELWAHKLVEREARLGQTVQFGQLRLKPKGANEQSSTVFLHALRPKDTTRKGREESG